MKILQELIKFQHSNKKLNDLNTLQLGRKYIYCSEIDSTQKEIWRMIEQNNILNGTLIRAEKQTNGIGTHGRKWYTKEANIAFSFYYEVNCNIKKIEGITIQIAETIVNIIKEMYKINLEIKLPNDIYVKNKKLGGILTETKVKGNMVKFLVVGIGLNNNQLEFEDEIKDIATSFKKEFGINIDTEKFISEFCNRLEKIILKRIEDAQI